MDKRAFFREHIASPTLLVGAVFALSAGLSFGSFLKAGEVFNERAAPQVVIDTAMERNEAVSYMTDANGRVPSYVIGTDRLYQPTELPLVRTAWEEPAPVIENTDDLPALVPNEVRPAPAAYAPPPSVNGDILAISTTAEPTPVG